MTPRKALIMEDPTRQGLGDPYNKSLRSYTNYCLDKKEVFMVIYMENPEDITLDQASQLQNSLSLIFGHEIQVIY